MQPDNHRARSEVHELYIFDVEINVAFFTIERGQPFAIFLEFVVAEKSAACEPRPHPVTARAFEQRTKLTLFDLGCADELDSINPDLGTLLDLKRGCPTPCRFVHGRLRLHLSAWITFLLIQLFNGARVSE